VFVLNPNSGIPVYRQLREQVRRMVLSGQLRPGTELPSVRELAAIHALNPMTISKAYSLLEAEGLLERHRGKPMTVAERNRPALKPLAQIRALQPQLEQLVLAARQLRVGEAELVRALRKQWEEMSEPVSD
jgi:DNA-binding transcriptional regulator YhcF (GntR family)